MKNLYKSIALKNLRAKALTSVLILNPSLPPAGRQEAGVKENTPEWTLVH